MALARCLAGSRLLGRRCCASATQAGGASQTVQDMMQKAANDRAELRSQLKAQCDLHKQRTEILQRSLEAAEAERKQLRDQVSSLTKDFDILASKMQEETIGFRDRIQRKGVKGKGAQSRMAYRPAIDYSEKQPSHVCELNHQSLAELAMLGDHCARRERLIREVMAVDNITWGQAHDVLNNLVRYNEKYYWFETLPYRVGITAAFLGGIGSYVLVFWKPAAEWYGVNVAGEELPEGVEDIGEMTTNQVGTWTWSWMEPMIGTASFVLLCAQFIRAQATKMNMKTYGDRILQWRGTRLAKAFPEYDSSMVRAWAKHLPKVGFDFFPAYETKFRQKGPSSGL